MVFISLFHSFIHIEHLYSASSRKLLRSAPNTSTVKQSSLKVRKKRRRSGSVKNAKFRREAVRKVVPNMPDSQQSVLVALVYSVSSGSLLLMVLSSVLLLKLSFQILRKSSIPQEPNMPDSQQSVLVALMYSVSSGSLLLMVFSSVLLFIRLFQNSRAMLQLKTKTDIPTERICLVLLADLLK